MTKIQRTSDYSIFKKLPGNRNIDNYNLKKLVEAIKNDNYLELHPIIVNGDHYVIDGQHRLEAAKVLGVEIYYIRSESVTEMHLVSANVNQKSFLIHDYINYFAIRDKKPDYLRFVAMMKSTGLAPKSLMVLFFGTMTIQVLNSIKYGEFKLPSEEYCQTLLDLHADFVAYAEDKRITPMGMFKNNKFTKALRWIHNTDGFNKDVLFKKLDQKWFDLKPQSTPETWYELLLDIYNFKNSLKLDAKDRIED